LREVINGRSNGRNLLKHKMDYQLRTGLLKMIRRMEMGMIALVMRVLKRIPRLLNNNQMSRFAILRLDRAVRIVISLSEIHKLRRQMLRQKIRNLIISKISSPTKKI
jgi:hypothetical protein